MSAATRAVAAQVIAQVYAGRSLNTALPEGLEKVAVKDRALLQELCFGSLRLEPRLQAIIEQLVDKPLRDKDRDIHCLLLIGLYQLHAMRIPPHAAVSTTVEAVFALKKKWAKGLVNAVLRRYSRESEELLADLSAPAVLAHPPWLFSAIAQQWPHQADAILQVNNQRPPMALRVNTLGTSREDYLQQLTAAGIEAQVGALSPYAVYLSQPRDVSELPGFAEGLVSVQDEAAQLAAILLAPEPGERILDACAAPGGKSCHLLELQPALKELVVADVDNNRLQRVAENLHRLQLRASVVCMDATAPSAEITAKPFDRILVDAPCSGSGVIRRHPDIKLLRRRQDITQLAAQQLAILQALWPSLKSGGSLLYVTCSMLEQENSDVIQTFLQGCADAQLDMPSLNWGEPAAQGRQLLPTDGGADGLFFARLKKSA